jgi:regulator of replication initiation timing
MTIDLAKFLAILGATVTVLLGTIKYLAAYLKDVVERERTRLLQENESLQEQLAIARAKVEDLQNKRLQESQEHTQAEEQLSHRFRQALHAIVAWGKQRTR